MENGNSNHHGGTMSFNLDDCVTLYPCLFYITGPKCIFKLQEGLPSVYNPDLRDSGDVVT